MWPQDPTPEVPLRFRLVLAQGPLEFEGVSVFPAWTPGGSPLALPIQWHVVAPRLEVRLKYPDDKHAVTGVGYADCVEIGRPPRFLGVRQLRWGRAHGTEGAFAFTSVVSQEGVAWQRAANWSHGKGLVEWDGFHLEEGLKGMTLRTNSPSQHPPQNFRFGNERVLRKGEAMDCGRFPHARERFLYRLMMGSAAESRWAGFARLGDSEESVPANAVHESVDFGARFARATDQPAATMSLQPSPTG